MGKNKTGSGSYKTRDTDKSAIEKDNITNKNFDDVASGEKKIAACHLANFKGEENYVRTEKRTCRGSI